MKKEKLVKEFTNAVNSQRKLHEGRFNGTYYWILNTDAKNNNWAIVLGWSDDGDEDDDYMDGTYRLCAKLAYQPHNSLMQCDYDVDWIMPYNEESGDVDDTEIPIYSDTNIKEVIDWLLDCYNTYFDIDTYF